MVQFFLATTPEKKARKTGFLCPVERASHLPPSLVAQRGCYFKRGSDTTAAELFLCHR